MQPTQQPSRVKAYRAGTLVSYSLAVERVIEAMHAHVSEPLSLDEMAEIAYLSPFHFHRMFRSLTGIPPGEFLAALRLDAAKRLLLTTSLSVTDVCFALGYASLGTFTQRFKQLIGLSPLQLRQLTDELAGENLTPWPLSTHGEGDMISHSWPRGGAQQAAPLQRALRSTNVARASADARASTARPSEGVGGLPWGEGEYQQGMSGAISTPGSFRGLIFAGLFPKPVPQGRPVACVTLAAPGRYETAPVPDGRYYLLAAAVPWSPSALEYLLPDRGLLVGVAERPVLVRGGRASAPVNLALRPRQVADPPILGVFPPLLATPAAARVRVVL